MLPWKIDRFASLTDGETSTILLGLEVAFTNIFLFGPFLLSVLFWRLLLLPLPENQFLKIDPFLKQEKKR